MSGSQQFYNTPWDHSSDATFRAWGAALSAAIVAGGAVFGKLVPTTDTGQINWTTVTRPGTNTVAGYEIYKFADTNAGTAPVYIKLEYGTGTTAAVPQIWVTVGTGSNGSGTLTGFTTTRTIWTRQTVITSTVTNYPTYFSSTETCPFALFFKLGAGSASTGFGLLGIGRDCNLDGSIRTDAVGVYTSQNNQSAAEWLRFSDGTKFGSSINHDYCMVPMGITATSVAGSFQAFQHVTALPQIYGVNWISTVLASEVALNTQDSATLYGATAHNYVSAGATLPGFSTQQTAGHAPFLIYE